MEKRVRVRFAPSPTGPLHIGGVRTALYNYLFARKHGGDFLLRIEDTDQTRYVPGAEEYIMESLKWCGLDLDEGPADGGPFGPYRQSERKYIYARYAHQLLESGHAYYAFDTPEELDEMRENLKKQGVPSPQYNAVTRQYMKNSLTLPADEVQRKLEANEPHVIRIKVPRNEEVRVNDIIRGWVVFNSSQIDDKVIFKSDGMPTYHLANVVDDHLMKITHVIRGEEWLPSTPIHVLLYRFLGWEEIMPSFAHLPLILKPDGNGKLSKRDGDRLGFPVFSLDWTNPDTGEQSRGFRERGFLPEAFNNMLAFLGWNPGTSQEIFSMDELIGAFSLERIGKAGARFDFEKAKWYNQQFIKLMDPDVLFQRVLEQEGERLPDMDPGILKRFIVLFQDRVTFISDFSRELAFLGDDDPEYDAKVVRKKWKEDRKPVFREILDQLRVAEPFSSETIEAVLKGAMEKHGLGFGDSGGPPVFELASLMGKDLVCARMERAMVAFESLVDA